MLRCRKESETAYLCTTLLPQRLFDLQHISKILYFTNDYLTIN